MALNAAVVWEVRGQTGNDANGGGFKSTATGTDRSLSGTPHVTIDGATITCIVHTTTTQLNIVGYTVTNPGDIGNIVNINGGTMTQGRYEITAADTANNRWTVDRSAGTSTQTGTGRMGGCLASISIALAAMNVAQMLAYVKADGTYNITTALTSPATGDAGSRLIGYTSTRTDQGQVTIATGTANPAINGFTPTTQFQLENFIIDGTATSGLQGLIGISAATSIRLNVVNCRIHHFANEGFLQASGAQAYLFDRVEVDHCAGTNGAVGSNAGTPNFYMFNCYIHDNTKPGIYQPGSSSVITHSIIANNTGHGVHVIGNTSVTLRHCILYGNTGDGIRFNQYQMNLAAIANNIFAKNGGYGINLSTAGVNAYRPSTDYNGYWSNTSGPLNNLTQGLSDVVITGVDPTNDPFVDKANKDWSLNDTAGAGALLRAMGFPGALAGLATPVGALDVGPYQHEDPAGGGGVVRVHMTGGMVE